MFGLMVEVDSASHVCGNCEYWKGYRRKNETGQKVLVEKISNAKCINKLSPWNDMAQLSMSTCHSWVKWSNLS